MNYPIQGLTIIAPILFLLLMIGIPVIGVFAGWKRAAYWGGGTFFFFLVGMIIWKTAGTAISNTFAPMINELLKDMGVTATPTLIASLAAPAFFLIVMALAELILLINYYAWFKKISGIKKDVEAKKAYKQAVKNGKKPSTSKVQGWTSMQLTTKGKAINMTCGAAGMALLFAPSTVAFTQAVMYTTTSATTRLNSEFCNALYNSLETTASAFSWMSYYGDADSGKDYSSLWATLTMSNDKITYTDPKTGKTEEASTITAVGAITSNGISNIVDKATGSTSQSKDEQLTSVSNAVNALADSWNALMSQSATDITALFQSANVTEMLEPLVEDIMGGKDKLDANEVYKAYIEDGSLFKQIVDQVKEGYQTEGETISVTIEGVSEPAIIKKLDTIAVSQSSFNNIKDAFMSAFDTSTLAEENKAEFESAFSDILSMLFYVA